MEAGEVVGKSLVTPSRLFFHQHPEAEYIRTSVQTTLFPLPPVLSAKTFQSNPILLKAYSYYCSTAPPCLIQRSSPPREGNYPENSRDTISVHPIPAAKGPTTGLQQQRLSVRDATALQTAR